LGREEGGVGVELNDQTLGRLIVVNGQILVKYWSNTGQILIEGWKQGGYRDLADP
jgi:hypothetical protein